MQLVIFIMHFFMPVITDDTNNGQLTDEILQDVVFKKIMELSQDEDAAVEFASPTSIYSYRRAKEQNDARSTVRMADMLEIIEGYSKYSKRVIALRELAANQGDVQSMLFMARYYDDGMHNKLRIKNPVMATKMYEMAVDADCVDAMRMLGERYTNGYYVPQNFVKARKLLSKVAKLGDQWAAQRLAYTYELETKQDTDNKVFI